MALMRACALCLSLLIIGGVILYFTLTNLRDSFVEKSLDTSEASLPASRYVNLHWIDLYCPSDLTVVSDDTIKSNLLITNAILMRSGSTFKLTLASRRSLYKNYCNVEVYEYAKQLDVIKSVNDLFKFDTNMTGVAAISATFTTAGGYARNSTLAFVAKTEVEKKTKVLIHELGHVWGLPHPFDFSTLTIGDVPKVCASGTDRSRQLMFCPSGLRTCRDAQEDEKLDNVMDYLPGYCATKFTFTPMQMAMIEKSSNNLIFPLR